MDTRARKRAKAMPENAEDMSTGSASCSAQEFWDKHVCKRKPKLFLKMPTTYEWNTAAWVKDFPEYLKKRAGGWEVQVECRENSKGNFGLGYKRTMTFGTFLKRLAGGDTSLYLTTQEVKFVEELGVPKVLGELMLRLQGDFPAVPEILGNLVPHQINPWIGSAPEGSSSGLHHDYHDNLYCLLKGRKRFRLYPPAMAHQLYMHGEIFKVHPNGRIVYPGWETTRADGAWGEHVERFEAKHSAEKELSAAEAEVARQKQQRGNPSQEARTRLKAAEDRMEEIMQEGLEGYAEEDCAYEDDDHEEEEYINEEDWSDEEGYSRAGVYTEGKRPNTLDLSGGGYYDPSEDMPFSGLFHGDEEWAGEMADRTAALPDEERWWPRSFSRIRDLDMDDAELKQKFPLFPGKAAAMEVIVNEGQMLYLPAGWFHEVTSYGQQHIALSYWMHPPDNLKPGPDGFQKPYTSDYWPETWKALQAQA